MPLDFFFGFGIFSKAMNLNWKHVQKTFAYECDPTAFEEKMKS